MLTVALSEMTGLDRCAPNQDVNTATKLLLRNFCHEKRGLGNVVVLASRHGGALGDYPVNQQLRAKFAKRAAQKAVLGLLLLRCLEGSEQRADALALRAVRLLYQK